VLQQHLFFFTFLAVVVDSKRVLCAICIVVVVVIAVVRPTEALIQPGNHFLVLMRSIVVSTFIVEGAIIVVIVVRLRVRVKPTGHEVAAVAASVAAACFGRRVRLERRNHVHVHDAAVRQAPVVDEVQQVFLGGTRRRPAQTLKHHFRG
jgi:hypothetical protein